MMLFTILAASFYLQTPAPAPAAPNIHFAKPRFVASGWPDLSSIIFIADIDGDKFGDLFAVHTNDRGYIEFARNVRGGKYGSGAIGAGLPDNEKLDPLAQIIYRTAPGARPELLLKRTDGVIYHFKYKENETCEVTTERPSLDGAQSQPSPVESKPAPRDRVMWTKDDTILRGDFDGDGKPDEVKDFKISFASGAAAADAGFLRDLTPNAKIAAGDFQGDGKDDILVLRNDGAWRAGRDLNIYLSYADNDTDFDGDGLDNKREESLKSDPLDADTDHDGLLDGWEVLGEGSVDLPLLGASPIHKDCVVYLQRHDNTNPVNAKNDIARAADYWSKLPAKNPDGAPGIHLITIWLGPLDHTVHGAKPWWTLGEENLPIPARGLAHYIIIGPGGGGQSGELADKGGCGEGALYATFLHEFGHQVGLSHAGGPIPEMCPTHTSLMNYPYSYGFNDDYNQIHYSNGELASLILNETKLSERVDVPYDKIKFLEKGPWRLKLKADGSGTWIDWNRNGAFDSGVIRADITDTYGVGVGAQASIGKTVFAPTVAVHKDKLLLFGVNRDKKLLRRANTDELKFTDEVFLSQAEPTGDPSAVSDGENIILMVPTKDGVVSLAGADDAALDAAKPQLLHDSAGCEAAAAIYKHKMICMLWRGPEQPVRFVERNADGSFTSPRDLAGIMSYICPGAVEDTITGDLCIGYTVVKKDNNQEKRSWRLARLRPRADGGFEEVNTKIIGGEGAGWVGNSRPILLFESGKDVGAAGRIHFMGVGWTDPPNRNGCFYEAISIGDLSQNDGWRLRRFGNEWMTTRSPIGACWYKNDIALAYRWFGNVHGDDDDNLNICTQALGISDQDMHDFDDVTEIAEVGLAHSIPWRMGTVK